eukprot:m.1075547 g.1075547  ORF g.1075547 m.1075547 type:complete len:65 (+) comp24242_c0_seq2:1418-1612(+)
MIRTNTDDTLSARLLLYPLDGRNANGWANKFSDRGNCEPNIRTNDGTYTRPYDCTNNNPFRFAY